MARLKYWDEESQTWKYADKAITNINVDLTGYATEEYVDNAIESAKENIGDFKAIIDVIELPTENIQEECFYRLLSGSLVFNQDVNNMYIVHCVETLPETGLPATKIDQIGGNIYYNVSDGEAYGYVDDILSIEFGVPVGWYPGSTLMGAAGYEYAGVIINILDDPRDNKFRLLLEYVVYDHKNSRWTSHEKIGWPGAGPGAEIFNTPYNKATGNSSHAEGSGSNAEGKYSHAEGLDSHAEGVASHAEGYTSHAEGYASHAEGSNSNAKGDFSHAEGYSSHAGGDYFHAEGSNSHANGNCSHAEGSNSHATSNTSHAEGLHSHAAGRSQHVQGEFNLVDPEYDVNDNGKRGKYAHIVGNGTSHTDRSNAHTLDWKGNSWYKGDVYVYGASQDDVAARKLATEERVSELINESLGVIENGTY